jgi:hypothetical protein
MQTLRYILPFERPRLQAIKMEGDPNAPTLRANATSSAARPLVSNGTFIRCIAWNALWGNAHVSHRNRISRAPERR